MKEQMKSRCILWSHSKNSAGYGQLKINGKFVLAHRFYYEQKYGLIPEGLVIDHLCRTTACINPDHLEPVTNVENIRRGKHVKINLIKAGEIRLKYKSGEANQNQLAREYSIDQGNISKIVKYKAWIP
jgi:hypothetical protein